MEHFFGNLEELLNWLRTESTLGTALMIALALSGVAYAVAALLSRRFLFSFHSSALADETWRSVIRRHRIIHYSGTLAAIVVFDLVRRFVSFRTRTAMVEGKINISSLIGQMMDAALFVVAVLLIDRVLKSASALYAETE